MGKRLTDKESRYMQENEISQAEDRISDILDDVAKPFTCVDYIHRNDEFEKKYKR